MSLSDLMLADKWNNSYKHQGLGALSVPTLTFLSFYIKMYHCTTELTHSMHKTKSQSICRSVQRYFFFHSKMKKWRFHGLESHYNRGRIFTIPNYIYTFLITSLLIHRIPFFQYKKFLQRFDTINVLFVFALDKRILK